MIFSFVEREENKPFRHHWSQEIHFSDNATRVLVSHKDKKPFSRIGVVETSRKKDNEDNRIYMSQIGPFVPSFNGLTKRYEYLVDLSYCKSDRITLYITHKSWWPKFTFSSCPYEFDFRVLN